MGPNAGVGPEEDYLTRRIDQSYIDDRFRVRRWL